MAVTMKNVRAALDPEEPNYAEAARLGAGALPHLSALVGGDDPMLASKAAYLASLIKDSRSAGVVKAAAASSDPTVRVAAAAAAVNLTAAGASTVLVELVDDDDIGVRKVARSSVPAKPVAGLATKLRAMRPEAVAVTETTEDALTAEPLTTGLMPGETQGDAPGGEQTLMPGERPGTMPGERSKMPGE